MKKAIKKSKKKVTLEVLADKIGEVASSVEDLAMITAKGFADVDKRFEAVDTKFEGVQGRLKELEHGQRKINNDILDVADRYVKKHELDALALRVINLENNKKSKTK